MINIKTFIFNPFQVNCYLLYDHSGRCIIVDPSAYFDGEGKQLLNFIESKNLKPVLIFITHGHVDHIPGIRFLKDKYDIKTGIHRDDLPLFNNVVQQGSFFGFPVTTPPSPDLFLEHDQILDLLDSPLKIKLSPGHSPGSLLLYSEADKMLITGDVLFQGSIGRTDFPGGNYKDLIKSIKEEILTLPDETKIYPGHGPPTTIGEERMNNPFL